MGVESSTETTTGADPVTPPVTDPAAPEGSSDPKETPNQEAARHRVRAKEAEAERDALAGVVESLRTSIVNERVEAAGINPALLWASGVTVADLLSDAKEGEDGAGLVDTTKVDAAIEAAREKFDLPSTTLANPLLGMDSDGEPKRSAFLDALRPQGT